MLRNVPIEVDTVKKMIKGDDNMGVFYVRCLIDKIPAEKNLKFKDDRNYPVLAVNDNKLLTHDDTNRLIWLPISIFKFVKVN